MSAHSGRLEKFTAALVTSVGLCVVGCAHFLVDDEVDRMNIECQIFEVPDPSALKQESMPHPGLVLNKPGSPISGRDVFIPLVERFNRDGDELLNEVFRPLLGDRAFSIPVVVTHGIPAPYDAWTADYQGKRAFFFNLSEWDTASLQRSGMAVVKHEITHVLLAELLRSANESSPIDVLNHMVINEGIAHFIGSPHDRRSLLASRQQEFKRAEEALALVQRKLADPATTPAEIADILRRGNTGRFWDKYAAIAGMGRAALIFERHGAKGLGDAIRAGRLE